ncbi:hypothetical protein ACHAWF_007255 [Thalassiosira exigua]
MLSHDVAHEVARDPIISALHRADAGLRAVGPTPGKTRRTGPGPWRQKTTSAAAPCCPFFPSSEAEGLALPPDGEGSSPLVAAGFVLFFLPFACAGLGCVLAVAGALALGIAMMWNRMGMGTGGICIKLRVLLLASTSFVSLVALGDIGWNCAVDMFPILPFSVAFVGLIVTAVVSMVKAVDEACIRRWGAALEAEVRLKKRSRTSDENDGRVRYNHWILLTYQIQQPLPWIVVPTLEPTSTNTDDVENDTSCGGVTHGPRPILGVGFPVQHESQFQGKDSGNVNPKLVRKWVAVSGDLYERNNVGDAMEVSVLPRRPMAPVLATDGENGVGYVIVALFSIPFAIGFGYVGVVVPWNIFFTDNNCCDSCALSHVVASYAAASILLPVVFALVLTLPENSGGEGEDDGSGGDRELSTLSQRTGSETVMSEDLSALA